MLLIFRVIGIFVCGLLQCFADQLDVYFFNVGQASFTLLKTENRVVAIDCGTKRKTENNGKVHSKMKAFVSSALDGAKPLILISHMDDDHYCGLDDFFPEGSREMVIVGGIREGITLPLESNDVQFFENKVRGKKWIGDMLKKSEVQKAEHLFVNDQDGLKVACFFPEKNNVKVNGNEQSLMIKVTYSEKNILFPGDCSATLLEKLKKTEGFADFFKNIDVFVFSHHGDGHNGELNLFGVFVDQSPQQPEQQPHVPLCAIISSNPEKGNHIPKSEIAKLGLGTIKEHEISTYSLKNNRVEKRFISCPLYVTCDAEMAYQLTISSDGTWAELKNIDFKGRQLRSGFYPP